MKKLMLAVFLCASFEAYSNTPADAFLFVYQNVLPRVEGILKSKNIEYSPLVLYASRNSNLKPNDNYVLISENYKLLSQKVTLPAVSFKSPRDITPSDVVDLSKEVSAILEKSFGTLATSQKNVEIYEAWVKEHRNGGSDIVPGDVFYLNVYIRSLIQKL